MWTCGEHVVNMWTCCENVVNMLWTCHEDVINVSWTCCELVLGGGGGGVVSLKSLGVIMNNRIGRFLEKVMSLYYEQ